MPKQLGEFLKEKQEPFALEVYLHERGYLRNSSKKSTKILRRSASCSLHNKKRSKFIPNCSTFFTALVQVNNVQKIKNPGNRDRVTEMETRREGVEDDQDKFSSASSTIVFNSCSDSDIEEVHYPSSVHGDHISYQEDSRQSLKDGKEFERRLGEDSNQLSPVSVLEEIEFDDALPIVKTSKYAKITQRRSSISIPLSNLEKPFHSNARETQELIMDSKSFDQYTKNKKAVLQRKQLLFDCVRELVENQRNKSQQSHKIFGADELWKLVHEKIWLWSKEPIDETNIDRLVHFDLLTSAEELNHLEQQRRDIGVEIGDAIFEDISNDLLADMMNIILL